MIFTDLDGTFLNHNDYSFEASKEALHEIQRTKTPFIFTTSKTKAEVIQLQQKVGIMEPFITENGATLFIPKGYQGLNLDELEDFENYKIVVFGKNTAKLLRFTISIKKSLLLKDLAI